MARVDDLKPARMDRNVVHGPVQTTYTTFRDADGQVFLQIDTYGSPDRAIPGKKSQTIQFGPEGIAALRRILESL